MNAMSIAEQFRSAISSPPLQCFAKLRALMDELEASADGDDCCILTDDTYPVVLNLIKQEIAEKRTHHLLILMEVLGICFSLESENARCVCPRFLAAAAAAAKYLKPKPADYEICFHIFFHILAAIWQEGDGCEVDYEDGVSAFLPHLKAALEALSTESDQLYQRSAAVFIEDARNAMDLKDLRELFPVKVRKHLADVLCSTGDPVLARSVLRILVRCRGREKLFADSDLQKTFMSSKTGSIEQAYNRFFSSLNSVSNGATESCMVSLGVDRATYGENREVSVTSVEFGSMSLSWCFEQRVEGEDGSEKQWVESEITYENIDKLRILKLGNSQCILVRSKTSVNGLQESSNGDSGENGASETEIRFYLSPSELQTFRERIWPRIHAVRTTGFQSIQSQHTQLQTPVPDVSQHHATASDDPASAVVSPYKPARKSGGNGGSKVSTTISLDVSKVLATLQSSASSAEQSNVHDIPAKKPSARKRGRASKAGPEGFKHDVADDDDPDFSPEKPAKKPRSKPSKSSEKPPPKKPQGRRSGSLAAKGRKTRDEVVSPQLERASSAASPATEEEDSQCPATPVVDVARTGHTALQTSITAQLNSLSDVDAPSPMISPLQVSPPLTKRASSANPRKGADPDIMAIAAQFDDEPELGDMVHMLKQLYERRREQRKMKMKEISDKHTAIFADEVKSAQQKMDAQKKSAMSSLQRRIDGVEEGQNRLLEHMRDMKEKLQRHLKTYRDLCAKLEQEALEVQRESKHVESSLAAQQAAEIKRLQTKSKSALARLEKELETVSKEETSLNSFANMLTTALQC